MGSFTFQLLYPWYPLKRRLGEPQSQSGWWQREKFPAPAGNKIPVVQPVA